MKDIPGYEGRYSITEDGRVWSYPKHFKKGKFLIACGNRYLHVELWKNNKGKLIHVHRLVAITFLENPLNLPMVNHKNGIRTDNRVENLEWCTNDYNMRHAALTGLIPKGEKNPASKLSEAQVLDIRGSTITQKALAQKYCVSLRLVWLIRSRRLWKHI